MTSLAIDRASTTTGFPLTAAIALVAVAALVFSPLAAGIIPGWLVDYPKQMVLPVTDWVGRNLTWLAREAMIGGIKISEITRMFANIAEAPMELLTKVLATGFTAGSGENVYRAVPPLSWFTLSGLVVWLGYWLGGQRLALICAVGLAYLIGFGLWVDSMMTLASVIMATVVSVCLGLWLGTKAYHYPAWQGVVEAIMNVMQTVPLFSYLVPTLLFLGYGPSAALVATAIYAMPPMVHATILGLKSVPPEVIEYGHMAGATRRQIYWRIMVPSAVRFLGTGVNQTIMASLNMVIIASMIGAGGLGYLVLLALRRLDIGAALEAGMGIVVLAIILDRLSQAVAQRFSAGQRCDDRRYGFALIAGLWLVLATAFSFLVPILQDYPKAFTVTTAPYWNALISWINVTFFDVLDGLRSFTLITIMNPLKNHLLAVPWTVLVALVAVVGFQIGGLRLAASVALLLSFIAVTGFWDPAVTSVYLVTLGVLFSLLIGMPLGYLASMSPRLQAGVSLVLDTLQTLPTLVYIIPAVMLFRNGDFSAVLAIVSYAVAPAVRYAMLGFSNTPTERLEASAMSGATPLQTFAWVRLPHAVPTLILGLNQTVMMAFAMLVITALVGTRDLGQQVFIALSRMKVGDGIVGGLAVAALALTADAVLKHWAASASSAGARTRNHG